MMEWLKKFFEPKATKAEKLKIWAYRSDSSSPWTKVVSYEKPPTYNHCYSMIVGPFRSEVDCEEFCDFNNISDSHGYKIKLYSKV